MGGQPRVAVYSGAYFTHILLADEINRTPPKTQAALLEAMEEKQVTIGGQFARAGATVLRFGNAESH